MTARFRTLPAIDILVGLLSAVLIVLLFAGGPAYYAGPILNHVWNLGHVFAFFLWTSRYLARRWEWLNPGGVVSSSRCKI